MRNPLSITFGFLLMLLVVYDLLHWMATGELEAWFRYGWSRMLRWEDEPMQVVVAVVVKIGLFVAGGWMVIGTLLRDDPPQRE
jgi:hypothetical protein